MLAPAFETFPVVTDVTQPPANEAPPNGVPIVHEDRLTLWDLFSALQDAADESGATRAEADELVVASYFESLRSVVPG